MQVKAHRTAFFLCKYDNDKLLFIQRTPQHGKQAVGRLYGDCWRFAANFRCVAPDRNTTKATPTDFQLLLCSRFWAVLFRGRVSFEGNNAYELALRIDVLKSYESEILAATGRVSESDNPDPYISNRDTVYKRTPNFEKVLFSETGLLNENGGIIMVTLKGTTEN